MGMESVVYGFIQGPYWPHQERHTYDSRVEPSQLPLRYLERDQNLMDKIHQNLMDKIHQNLYALSTLPEEDTWPFLSRSMFSSSTNSLQTTYKSQIIHFGASFKNIEWEWEEWLTKFEGLLSTMYWDEVQLHLISEMFTSSFHYVWKDENEQKAIFPDSTNPVAHWTFSGEPRTFLPFLK